MGEKTIAISVDNLHICYRGLKKTSIRSSWAKGRSKIEIFEALKGVSFELEEGKILGIIGKNGSGKSTMLRAIAGIFSPDEGSIDLHGHSISLLSIGVGFNKKLSGRENIYLSGMLLGFSEEEIDQKIDEIIEFADIGDFINRPVKSYSSGMYSKLAFAITAILETDIMLIDEVLSVGDQRFKEKSYNKMKELISDENRTVVIVSHSMRTIQELCDEVLWINEGNMMGIGPTKEILPKYQAFMRSLDPVKPGAKKPAGPGAKKPAGAGAKKPAGAGAKKPAGADAKKPAGTGAKKPAKQPAEAEAAKSTEA